MDYNYRHFRAEYYDFHSFDGPKPGEKAIDFTAQTTEGKTIRLSNFRKPTILEAGSITCPIFVGKINRMQALSEKYPNFQFIVLYTREAHPGNKIPPHRSTDEKKSRAKQLCDEHGDRRLVLVDDLEGSAHKAYGLFPDVLYVIDDDSTVVYRAIWNDPHELENVLTALNEGKKPAVNESHRFVNAPHPSLTKFAYGGRDALLDFLRAFPGFIYRRIVK